MNIKGALVTAIGLAMATPVFADASQFGGLSFGATVGSAADGCPVGGCGGGTILTFDSAAGPGLSGTTRRTLGLRGGYNWAVNDSVVLGVNGGLVAITGGGGGPNIRRIYDVRLQAGYAMSSGMVYAAAGAARGSFGSYGSSNNGSVIALGFQAPMAPNLDFLIEYAGYRFQSGGGNPQANVLTVGVMYRH